MSEHSLTVIATTATAVLVVVWIAYPALMGLLASARAPQALPPVRPDDTVTVLLISREAPDVIRARVDNLLNTTFPADRLDLIVVLDSKDSRSTPEDLKDLGGEFGDRVRVIVGDLPGGKAAGMNAGMRAATGRYVVLADTFQTFTRDTITRLASALQAPDIAAVSGRLVLAPTDDTVSPIHLYWAYETWLRGCEAHWHSCVGVFGPVNAIKREHWAPLRPGLILDDVYTPMRLVLQGYRVGFVHSAVAIDVRTSKPDSEYRRKVRTLTGNIQLCLWLPAVLNPFQNPIWLQFVCHKLGRLMTPYAFILAVVAGLGLALQHVGRIPVAVPTLLVLGVLVTLSSSALRHGVARLGTWVLSMQAAVVMATVNGVRGRWDVWSR